MSADRAYQLIESMAALGPRVPGSPALVRFEDLLIAGFTDAGCAVQTLTYAAPDRTPTDVGLTLYEGDTPVDVPIAGYYPDSGCTPISGVAGSLWHAGEVSEELTALSRDLTGMIVVVEYPVRRSPLAHRRVWGVRSEVGDPAPTESLLGFQLWETLEHVRVRVGELGATALVVARTGTTDDDATGQYQPIFPPSARKYRKYSQTGAEGERRIDPLTATHVPALWVGPGQRDRLVGAAHRRAAARLTVAREPAPLTLMRTIVATLRGISDESIVLITHVDGVNAVQENGPAMLLALADAFAAVPRERRRRTIVFACVAGHLARTAYEPDGRRPAVAETEGLLDALPDLLTRTVAALGIEHLGATEWINQGTVTAPTGRNEWIRWLTADAGLAEIALRSIDAAGADRFLVADAPMWGIPYPFAAAGVPTSCYTTTPTYLMAEAPDGHLSRISRTRLNSDLVVLSNWIRAVSDAPT